MRATLLWATGPDGTRRAVRCHLPIRIAASGTTPAVILAAPADADKVVLMPIEPRGDACAVALVPDACESVALLNGALVRCGFHVLHHADRLAVDGREIWVSIAAAPDEALYDPAVHGDPVYCLRTKARLAPGDRMIVCGGTARVECGMRYAAAAWGAGIPCHACGASPEGDAWAPPEPRSSGSLEQLLRLAREA